MQLARPAIAVDPKCFGRGPKRLMASPVVSPRQIGDDLKLFAVTFAAGFLFVSILIS